METLEQLEELRLKIEEKIRKLKSRESDEILKKNMDKLECIRQIFLKALETTRWIKQIEEYSVNYYKLEEISLVEEDFGHDFEAAFAFKYTIHVISAKYDGINTYLDFSITKYTTFPDEKYISTYYSFDDLDTSKYEIVEDINEIINMIETQKLQIC